MPTYALTWGPGGQNYTLTGLTLAEARAEEPTVRAWGTVILVRQPGDVLRSLRTGYPWHDQDADRSPEPAFAL